MEKLYQKLVNGDHLTNAELKKLKDNMEVAANILLELGPVFRLTAIECHRCAEQMRLYQEARKNTGRDKSE